MPGPWEQYQATDDAKPWEKYGAAAPPTASAVPARRSAAAIPVGLGADGQPTYADQRAPAPVAPQDEPGVMGALKRVGAQAYGGLEAATTLGTGATTGFLGGLLNAANNIASRVTHAVTGEDTSALPSTEQAFTQGMQAGTFQPRTPAGQAQAEAAGGALQEHGPALMGLGPELAALGESVGAAARPAAAAARDVATRAGEAVVPTITPQRAANAAAGMEQGLTFAPHQLAESKYVKMAGEAAEHVPGAFGGMRRAERQEAFNRAVIKHVNPESDATRLTGDVLGEAMDRSGGKIGEITGKTDLPLEDVQPALEAQRRALGRATEDQQRVVGGYIAEFERLADENDGVIPGDRFKALNSELGTQVRANAGNPTGHLLSDLQDTMLDAFRDKLSPEDRTTYDTSRTEYAKAKTLLPLVAKSVEGDISPASLMQAINATKAGKNSMGRGRGGELGELARAGKYLVDAKSSGTAERSLVQQLILDPIAGVAKVATAYPGAAAYNLAGPAISRAMVRKGLRRAGGASEDLPPAGGEPAAPVGGAPEDLPPAGGGGGGGGEPVDPRLASVDAARKTAGSDAVRAALDAHEKTVRKVIASEQAAKKQAADVDALEAAAKATLDPDLRKTLQARADKLRGEKLPTGEATELATTPTPKPEKPSKIPVGKVIEGAPLEPAAPAAPAAQPIPAGEATEIAPEVIEPSEPTPAGEASPLPSNVPQAEADAYAHRALFDEATRRGIEVRGRRPSEVRTAFEADWRREHGLGAEDAERAKSVAQALNIDEAAVERAAAQHEKSPRAFDRVVQQIIEQGAADAPEAKQAAVGSQSNPPNPAGGKGSASAGRGGNANDGAGIASGDQGNPDAGSASGATQAAAQQPGADSATTAGTDAAADAARGQAATGKPVADLRKKWPGLASASDEHVLAAEKWNNAVQRLVRESGNHDIGNSISDALVKAWGQRKIAVDQPAYLKELTTRLDAAADALRADRETPGTLANRRETKESAAGTDARNEHMHKANLEEIALAEQQIKAMHAQGRITGADLPEMLEIARTSPDSFETASRLHVLLEKKIAAREREGLTRGPAANEPKQHVDKRGDAYAVSVKTEDFGADKGSKSVLVEARDPKTGERRGFVDFEVRPDGVLTAGNVKVAPEFRGRDIAPMMYKAARDAGYDIAPGSVQTDLGNKLVDKLIKQGVMNKEAAGPRFRAGDLDLAPIEGESIPGEKATRPDSPKGFEKGAQKTYAKGNSWVLREKSTGKVIAETYDPKKVAALNTAKYEAIPIGEYLAKLNPPKRNK